MVINNGTLPNQSENYSNLQSAAFQSRITAGSLTSPTRQLSVTVTFWYYLVQGNAGLVVMQQMPLLDSGPVTHYSQHLVQQIHQTPENVDKWMQATVKFCLNSKDSTQIVIRAESGSHSDFSFVGLDEVITYRNTGNTVL